VLFADCLYIIARQDRVCQQVFSANFKFF